MKMTNAFWTATRSQPFVLAIESTNSVQPYWKFAIITMQRTPTPSWNQRSVLRRARAASIDEPAFPFVVDAADSSFVVMGVPPRRVRVAPGRYVVVLQSRRGNLGAEYHLLRN